MLHVLSDLHLDDGAEEPAPPATGGARRAQHPTDAKLFHDSRQGQWLAKVLGGLQPEDELVLLGDTFDFTAMQPPEKGLERFFRRLDVRQEVPGKRTPQQLIEAIRRANPTAFEALQRCERLTVVPGNHDRQITQELLAQAGIRASVERSPQRTVGGKLVVLQHGHEVDKHNATPDGGGEAMTAALHQGVIPFLRDRVAPRNVRMEPDRIVALRPEEAVVSVLQRWMDEGMFRKFFGAFLDLLSDNGYLPRPVNWLARVLTIDQLRRSVGKADLLWEHTGSHSIEVLKRERKPAHGAPPPDVFVLGHTHVLDWAVEADRLYVNLGTWTERALDGSSPLDKSLPLLTLFEKEGRFKAELKDLEAGEVLQRFE
jgi:UDP-2,3-diacylglucosamine pyrophosphatase LpxH